MKGQVLNEVVEEKQTACYTYAQVIVLLKTDEQGGYVDNEHDPWKPKT